jgi:hypothetical protein
MLYARVMSRDDSEEPSSTELDLRLPTDIAVRHAEESFESKETLLKVDLPAQTHEATPPVANPAFDPSDFPAPKTRADRTTEYVDVPSFVPPKGRQGSPLLWALIGAAIAFTFVTVVYLVALR